MNDLVINDVKDESMGFTDILMNPSVLQQFKELAEMMAKCNDMVPKHFNGNVGGCFAVIMQAAQWNMNPFSVAQKTYIVSGSLGYEAQLVNAVVSSSKAISGRFNYEYTGDWSKHQVKGCDCAIRCGAIIKGESEITWGEWLFIDHVTTKNSPLWKTAPKQQAAYLVVKYWARLYCPEVILGVYSHDEIESKPETKVIPAHQAEHVQTLLNQQQDNTIEPESNNDSVSLVDVLRLISDSETMEQLTVAGELAAKLDNGHKDEAKAAYKTKRIEIKNKSVVEEYFDEPNKK